MKKKVAAKSLKNPTSQHWSRIITSISALLLLPLTVLTMTWFYYMGPFDSFQSKTYAYAFWVMLPLFLLILTAYSLIRSFRTHIPIHRGMTFLSLCVIGAIGFSAASLFYSERYPPTFFPTDDPEATYTINYDDEYDMWSIEYKSTSDRTKHWACTTVPGEKQKCGWEYNRFMDILIGKSPVELTKFKDKKVKVTGSFVYTKKQCIAEKCVPLYGDGAQRFAAFDINTIQ